MNDPRTYAAKVHEGQSYGAEPYTVHLEAVVAIVRGVESSEEAVAVAWLHDAVEDTEATNIEIYHAFGPCVATAVMLLTDPPGFPNRRTRKAELHRTLATLEYPNGGVAERLALLVKAADRLANMRACVENSPGKLKMYRNEHEAFRAAAHRPGLCDEIWAELDGMLGEGAP